jgi:hypothetical protein
MKINQIPDIYIEQYLLGELPESLRKEMDDLILQDAELNDRINIIKKSNEEILSKYPAASITADIIEKAKIRKNISKSEKVFSPERDKKSSRGFITDLKDSLRKIMEGIKSISSKRYTLSLASAAVIALVLIFIIPGIRNTDSIKTPYDDTVRIKGLDSKLLLYRMKGKEVEELKNLDSARRGEIIQVGYIAAGDYKHGIILSIDGRGTVTIHLPEAGNQGRELAMNKRILLDKSYKLDDSPYFERFIMILSANPVDTDEAVKNAKKLAMNRDSALNGSIKTDKNSIEFSVIIKKAE